MYAGIVLTLLGWAGYLMSPLALIGPVAFAWFTHRFQVLPEERMLAYRFGQEYET